MKDFLYPIIPLTVICKLAVPVNSLAQTKDPVGYVDLFIRTDFFGHTFPGASLPYDMVRLSPDFNTQGWTYCAGYDYGVSSILNGNAITRTWLSHRVADGGILVLQMGSQPNNNLGNKSADAPPSMTGK